MSNWKLVCHENALSAFPLNFSPNLGEVRARQGEKLHQNISVIEGQYQGRFDARMVGNFCR